jgi:CheY-like chemotaxis protein
MPEAAGDPAVLARVFLEGPEGADSPRAVVLDDHLGHCAEAAVVLQQLGYSVEGWQDKLEYLVRRASSWPDLVVTNQVSSGMSGVAFARALRSLPGGEAVPVILLSRRAGKRGLPDALGEGTGICAVVKKPATASGLFDAVESAVRWRMGRPKAQCGAGRAGAGESGGAAAYSALQDLFVEADHPLSRSLILQWADGRMHSWRFPYLLVRLGAAVYSLAHLDREVDTRLGEVCTKISLAARDSKMGACLVLAARRSLYFGEDGAVSPATWAPRGGTLVDLEAYLSGGIGFLRVGGALHLFPRSASKRFVSAAIGGSRTRLEILYLGAQRDSGDSPMKRTT